MSILQGELNNPRGNFQQYRSRLARFFGTNAQQTPTQLIIQKSDLQGLIPSVDNSPESILVALLLHVLKNESNSITSNVYISFFRTEFISSNTVSLIVHTYLVQIYKLLIYEDDRYPSPITNSNAPITPKDF